MPLFSTGGSQSNATGVSHVVGQRLRPSSLAPMPNPGVGGADVSHTGCTRWEWYDGCEDSRGERHAQAREAAVCEAPRPMRNERPATRARAAIGRAAATDRRGTARGAVTSLVLHMVTDDAIFPHLGVMLWGVARQAAAGTMGVACAELDG